MYQCTHTCTHVHIYACTCTYVEVYVRTHISMCVHMYTFTAVHLYPEAVAGTLLGRTEDHARIQREALRWFDAPQQ